MEHFLIPYDLWFPCVRSPFRCPFGRISCRCFMVWISDIHKFPFFLAAGVGITTHELFRTLCLVFQRFRLRFHLSGTRLSLHPIHICQVLILSFSIYYKPTITAVTYSRHIRHGRNTKFSLVPIIFYYRCGGVPHDLSTLSSLTGRTGSSSLYSGPEELTGKMVPSGLGRPGYSAHSPKRIKNQGDHSVDLWAINPWWGKTYPQGLVCPVGRISMM